MPQRVVQILEVVQVNEQQGAACLIASADHQRLGQTVKQQAAVGQIGQRVIKRQANNVLFTLLLRSDIPPNAAVAGEATVTCKDWRTANGSPQH